MIVDSENKSFTWLGLYVKSLDLKTDAYSIKNFHLLVQSVEALDSTRISFQKKKLHNNQAFS